MAQRRIVIAGTNSGVGKTTLTIGLMAAFIRKGYTVQGFKCGPDYIDPTYHTAVTGRLSRNLDSWMFDHEVVKEIFIRASNDADISIIEGVMGFFDGKDPLSNKGSTAEISLLLNSPVLLVINCESMARTAAAIVKGFQCFTEGIKIAGVIANKVGSPGHFELIKKAVEQECGIPVIGYLQREQNIQIPERHLGLIPSVERGELEPLFEQLAQLISRTIDIERLLEIAEAEPVTTDSNLFQPQTAKKIVKIAVAKDSAFHFYYPENLELLESFGAKLIFFSPLHGDRIPDDVDGLYIGGGFPEEFAKELSENQTVLASFRQQITGGLPTFAECGGFMYLTESITTTDNYTYPMVGLIPGRVHMQRKLAAIGYREITGLDGNYLVRPGDQARGHEFHYSTFTTDAEIAYAYQAKGLRGVKQEGYIHENLVAGYTHLHFASNPSIVENWINKCLEYQSRRSVARA